MRRTDQLICDRDRDIARLLSAHRPASATRSGRAEEQSLSTSATLLRDETTKHAAREVICPRNTHKANTSGIHASNDVLCVGHKTRDDEAHTHTR